MSERKGIRVLIAEPEKQVIGTIRKPLEDAGYVIVGEASDCQEAAQMAQPLRPDVILVGIEVPEREHIAAIRQMQSTNPAPVVVMTARETPELREWAAEAGVGAYLVNRNGVREVERAVAIAIARHNDMTELRRLNAALRVRTEEQEQATRLYRRTVERTQARMRELAALDALGQLMNRTRDLDVILSLALDSAAELAGMDAGGILLLDPSADGLVLRAHVGASAELIRTAKGAAVDEGVMPQMLTSVTVVGDLNTITQEQRAAIEQAGLQFLVGVPLRSREGPVGVMLLASQSPRSFCPEEEALLATIGNQIGLAVDRANRGTQELRAAILEERQAMARQMHDDIAQTLGYLGLQMDVVIGSPDLAEHTDVQAELEKIRVAIDDAYVRVRDSIARLQEEIPSHFNLPDALQEIVAEFEKQTGCAVVAEIDADCPLPLSPLAAMQAAYIVREALTNARKHASADTVHLTLTDSADGAIEIIVQDNGQGFHVDPAAWSNRAGFGLRFMRERAQRIGGDLSIDSQPGRGTRVVVHLPSS